MSEVMHMVSATQYAADGHTVLYGAGELHTPGSLPEGVPYREVLASEAFAASAPAHAQAAPKAAAKAETRVQAGAATASAGAKSK